MVALDVDPGNYFNLRVRRRQAVLPEPSLHRRRRPRRPGRGGLASRSSTWRSAKPKTVLQGRRGFALSADGKKILYAMRDGKFGIIDAKADQKPAEKPLRTGEMTAKVDPRAEWRQMFRDAWRQERDFFYDPGHARRRLGPHVRALRPARALRRPRRGLQLRARRDDRRAEQLPLLRAPRRHAPTQEQSAPACWAAPSPWTAKATATGSAASIASGDWNAGTPTPLQRARAGGRRRTTTS